MTININGSDYDFVEGKTILEVINRLSNFSSANLLLT